MPAVNGVGEPCAGEPHARFEAAGTGNGADLAKDTGVAQPTGKPAATKAPGPKASEPPRQSPTLQRNRFGQSVSTFPGEGIQADTRMNRAARKWAWRPGRRRSHHKISFARRLHVIGYRATLDVPRGLASFVARLLLANATSAARHAAAGR